MRTNQIKVDQGGGLKVSHWERERENRVRERVSERESESENVFHLASVLLLSSVASQRRF